MFRRQPGQIIVPPSCPNLYGQPFDIAAADMEFMAHECENDANGNATVVEFFATFNDGELDDYNYPVNYVDTQSVLVDIHSQRAEQADGDPTIQRRIGELLCQRVTVCRGVVDGECWAFGETGMREAFEQAVDERA